MTPERIASLIHEAWEKFTHAAIPDISFYDSMEQAIITAINETREEKEMPCEHWEHGRLGPRPETEAEVEARVIKLSNELLKSIKEKPMSWSFKKVGKDKTALKASIQAESYCPQGLKDLLCSQIDSIDVQTINAIAVESDGHVDSATGGYGKFSVSRTVLIE